MKARVHEFWNTAACGEVYGADQDRIRYELEPEIGRLARFAEVKGKRLLEIGLGMGSDFTRFARAGARASGIDLTERAVEITLGRLKENNLTADVRVGDAEQLPFDDDSFDVVYSWGVLHHTPDTARAVREAVRVLVPGGSLRLMLYHRHSWVAYHLWLRHALLHGKPLASLAYAVSCTESPGTKAFTPSEVAKMLDGIVGRVEIQPSLTYWDRRYFPGVARFSGDRLGWFLLVEATK